MHAQLFRFAHLGNLPVLTEVALEIAAQGGDGIGKSAGKKVVERFFFDGVDIPGDEFAVGMGEKRPAPVLADLADAPSVLRDPAKVAAEKAGYLPVFEFLIEERFFQRHPPFGL